MFTAPWSVFTLYMLFFYILIDQIIVQYCFVYGRWNLFWWSTTKLVCQFGIYLLCLHNSEYSMKYDARFNFYTVTPIYLIVYGRYDSN